MYKTSQELIDILLKNGFRETTRKKYWEHYILTRRNKTYSDSVKRCFYQGGITVFFDYINIYILDKSDSYDCGVYISSELLRAIIYLAKSYRQKTEFEGLKDGIDCVMETYMKAKTGGVRPSDWRATRLVTKLDSIAI